MMPHYQCVLVSSLGYELGPVVVTTAELEERLAPAFTRLGIQPGQLEAWTGISERRWWQPNMPLSQGATAAARSPRGPRCPTAFAARRCSRTSRASRR